MRVPPENLSETHKLPRCPCCTKPIYSKAYKLSSDIESFGKVAFSIAIMFHFVHFMSEFMSPKLVGQFLHHRHLYTYYLPAN